MISTTFTYLSYWLCHYNNYIDVVVDTNDDASMDEIYVTYVADEHVDKHEYDDFTDDGHDNNKDSYGHNDYNIHQYSMYFDFNYRRRYVFLLILANSERKVFSES